MSTTHGGQQLEDANNISEVVSVMTSTGTQTRDQSQFASKAASLLKKSDVVLNDVVHSREVVDNILDRVDNRLDRLDQSNEGLIRDEDADFKLHVNPSLVIVICTNILMQVCFAFIQSSDIRHDEIFSTDLLLHHSLIFQRICCSSRWLRDLFGAGHWYSNCDFWNCIDSSHEIR